MNTGRVPIEAVASPADVEEIEPSMTDSGSAPWVRPVRSGLLAASDLAALLLAGSAAYAIWAGPVKSQSFATYAGLAPLFALFLGAYAVAGLYPGFGIGAVETLRRLSRQTSLVFLVFAALSFVVKLPATYSRVTFFIAWMIGLLTVPLFRYILLTRMAKRDWWPEPAVIVGTGRSARRVAELLDSAKTLGYRPVAAYAPEAVREVQMKLRGLPVLSAHSPLPDYAEHGIRVALVALEHDADGIAIVGSLRDHFRHVILVPSGDGLPVEGVVIRNLGGILGVEFSNQLLQRRNMIVKRMLDLTIGSAAFLFTLPLVAIVAAIVKTISRGPALYSQEREGMGGTPIRVWKIRSMFPDAEERLQALLESDEAARNEWNAHMKLRNDPRVLPLVGHFIRRFSIDELPQLWQVLRGELSLVGPRPFPQYHLRRFDQNFRAFRNKVRPGLTGLWQISNRSDASVEEQERMDTHYIRNWSVWLDLYVLVRTAGVVLSGKGAY